MSAPRLRCFTMAFRMDSSFRMAATSASCGVFTGIVESAKERADDGVAACRDQRGHIERGADHRAAALGRASPVALTTVAIDRDRAGRDSHGNSLHTVP